MKLGFSNWPRLVFIFVPLSIITVSAAVLTVEHLQPQSAKAIRLVRESTSRKENFTVQQYLYTTVYYRKSRGEQVEIEGWRADEPAQSGDAVTVEFIYSDASGRHVAAWEANVERGKVTPRNEEATDLSWR
jgi:hypothetical protein